VPIFSCPSCSQKISVSEAAHGKRVRCPKCQSVVAVPAGAAPPVPPPVPRSEQVADLSGPRRPRPQDEKAPVATELPPDVEDVDEDLEDEDREEVEQIERRIRRPRVSTIGTQIMLYAAFTVDLVEFIIIISNIFEGPPAQAAPAYKTGYVVGQVSCLIVFLSMFPFLLVGAICLGMRTKRGLVVNAGIMGTVLGSIMIIVFVVAIIQLIGAARAISLPTSIYVKTFVAFLSGCISLAAGIVALLTASNKKVKKSFR
jgi:DNA-directed RNA polymerase subunit RPC12/RpoP